MSRCLGIDSAGGVIVLPPVAGQITKSIYWSIVTRPLVLALIQTDLVLVGTVLSIISLWLPYEPVNLTEVSEEGQGTRGLTELYIE